MKIVFICGAAEPGKDGVGDYVRLLAASLVHSGHSAFIVSYNDRYIQEKRTETQQCLGAEITVLRLPRAASEQARFSDAKSFVQDISPDWISLQFVPFSYHEKGLSTTLAAQFAALAPAARKQIMFHELWVGMDTQSPLKLKLWGRMQKWYIKKLLRAVKPDVIHTHSQVYKAQLGILGFAAKLLPLYSNIPVVHEPAGTEHNLDAVVFGNIHFGGNTRLFAQWLKTTADDTGRTPHFHFIGNTGAQAQVWKESLKEAGIQYTDHGLCEPEYISGLLSKCTLGVASTPYLLTEKSGSVSAMLEHGLPVVAVAREWTPIEKPARAVNALQVINWTPDTSLATVLKAKQPAFNGVSVITERFKNDLNLQ